MTTTIQSSEPVDFLLCGIDCPDCAGCYEVGCLYEDIASKLANDLWEIIPYLNDCWADGIHELDWLEDYFNAEAVELYFNDIDYKIKILEPWGDEPEDDPYELSKDEYQTIFKSTARNLNRLLWKAKPYNDEQTFKQYCDEVKAN